MPLTSKAVLLPPLPPPPFPSAQSLNRERGGLHFLLARNAPSRLPFCGWTAGAVDSNLRPGLSTRQLSCFLILLLALQTPPWISPTVCVSPREIPQRCAQAPPEGRGLQHQLLLPRGPGKATPLDALRQLPSRFPNAVPAGATCNHCWVSLEGPLAPLYFNSPSKTESICHLLPKVYPDPLNLTDVVSQTLITQ